MLEFRGDLVLEGNAVDGAPAWYHGSMGGDKRLSFLIKKDRSKSGMTNMCGCVDDGAGFSTYMGNDKITVVSSYTR